MAAFDFPPNASHPAAPALGDKWPQPPVPGLPVYTWDGEKWTTKGGTVGSTGAADDLPLPNGVANAGLSLEWSRGDHVHPIDAATGDVANKVSKAGDTMTGPLLLPAATPTGATEATTKTYVDTKVAKAGDTMTGPLLLPAAAPTGATQATTKAYVDGILAPPPPFAAGTVMLFYQSTAPTGWTKQTIQNDKVLRVVSGASGGAAGGVQAFSTVFGRTTTDNLTLALGHMPSHQHIMTSITGLRILDFEVAGSGDFASGGQLINTPLNYYTGAAGSSVAHAHTIDLRVQYVDIILASKN